MLFLNRLGEILKGKAAGSRDVRGFSTDYVSLGGFNVAAAVANKLANIVCAEAEIEIENPCGDEWSNAIREAATLLSSDLRNIVSRVFGTGGVILRPYVFNGAVYFDAVSQERFFVIERQGVNIVKAGFIADVSGDFTRIETHVLTDGGYVIENKAFEGEREVPLARVPAWSGIEARTELAGVNKPLFSLLRCPVDARGDEKGDVYGVPITYGQEWLIKTISGLLNEVPLEYRNKRAFIGAEDLLFDSDDRLPETGQYKLLRGSGGDSRSFWEVFSPEIRHTSYFEGLNYLFGLLEKAILVNKGILTDLDASNATATAIRRSMFDTYNLVNAMRRSIEKSVKELVYAAGVLLAAEGRGVPGEMPEIRFGWSYSLLEDSSETFKQLIEGYDRGIVTKEEVRRFIF